MKWKLCIGFFIAVNMLVGSYSCIMTEGHMKEERIYLELYNASDCNQVQIEIEHGNIERIKPCLFRIIFYEARGGQTLLFGRVINDKMPQTQNIVSIYRGVELVTNLSYDDLITSIKALNSDSTAMFIFE
jgi:hypothetical protein